MDAGPVSELRDPRDRDTVLILRREQLVREILKFLLDRDSVELCEELVALRLSEC